MGGKEKEDAERELEMEKFRNHYRVATRNMKRRGDGGRLWTSQEWKLYDRSDEEKRETDIEEIVVQEIQAALSRTGQEAGGVGGVAPVAPVRTLNNKLSFQPYR